MRRKKNAYPQGERRCFFRANQVLFVRCKRGSRYRLEQQISDSLLPSIRLGIFPVLVWPSRNPEIVSKSSLEKKIHLQTIFSIFLTFWGIEISGTVFPNDLGFCSETTIGIEFISQKDAYSLGVKLLSAEIFFSDRNKQSNHFIGNEGNRFEHVNVVSEFLLLTTFPAMQRLGKVAPNTTALFICDVQVLC